MTKLNSKEADRSDTLTYNSNRSDMVIPEYGRGIHTMIVHMMSLADKEERSKCAAAIVSVMGSVVPPEGSEEEGKHKLWNQLNQMTGYSLDVDSPFSTPDPKGREESPARLDYPTETSRAGHFGRTIEAMIAMAVKMEEGEEKSILIVKLANAMKMHFLTWNRKTVEKSFISEQLKEKSGGALLLPEDTVLESSAEILRSIRKTSDALDRKWTGKKTHSHKKSSGNGNSGGNRGSSNNYKRR
jgi:hypothetical protein